jgi:hypothetical protein
MLRSSPSICKRFRHSGNSAKSPSETPIAGRFQRPTTVLATHGVSSAKGGSPLQRGGLLCKGGSPLQRGGFHPGPRAKRGVQPCAFAGPVSVLTHSAGYHISGFPGWRQLEAIVVNYQISVFGANTTKFRNSENRTKTGRKRNSGIWTVHIRRIPTLFSKFLNRVGISTKLPSSQIVQIPLKIVFPNCANSAQNCVTETHFLRSSLQFEGDSGILEMPRNTCAKTP